MNSQIYFSNVRNDVLQDSWNNKPLFIKQGATNLGMLANKEDFWTLCNQLEVVGFKKDATPTHWQDINIHDAENLYKKGMHDGKSPTIVLGQVEHLHQRTRYVLRWLDVPWHWSRLPTVFMSYSSYGGGIGVHYDDDDNIIFQAEGKRLWRVSRNRKLPSFPDQDGGIELSPDNSVEYILEPGDILYIPRGYWHEGVTLEESLSLTLGWDSLSIAEVLAFISAYNTFNDDETNRIEEQELYSYVKYVGKDFIHSNEFDVLANELTDKYLEYCPEYFRFYELEQVLSQQDQLKKRKIPYSAIEFIQRNAKKIPNWDMSDEQVTKGYAAFITKPIGSNLNNTPSQVTKETIFEQPDSTYLCYFPSTNSVSIFAHSKRIELHNSLELLCEKLCSTQSFSVNTIIEWGRALGISDTESETILNILAQNNFLLIRS